MDEIGLFDWALYGMLCRKRRNDLGYKTAEAFAKSVWRRTRLQLTRDILYKIEQGRQTPDAMQFMALNISLWGQIMPYDVIQMCASKEFGQVVSAYDFGVMNPQTYETEHFSPETPWVPNKWAIENSRNAEGVVPFFDGDVVMPDDYACQLSEPATLFRSRILKATDLNDFMIEPIPAPRGGVDTAGGTSEGKEERIWQKETGA